MVAYKRPYHFEQSSSFSVRPDPEGRYELKDLLPGTYSIMFSGDEHFFGEWFENAARERGSKPITVASGKVVSGVDADLERAGVITGRLTDEAGRPIRRCAAIERADGRGLDTGVEADWPVINNVYSQSDGSYILGHLRDGLYYVHFGQECNYLYNDGSSDGYRDEWYRDALSRENATLVRVAEGRITSGIDASLETQPRSS